MLYAETLKANLKFGSELKRLRHDFEERFKPGTDRGLTDSFYLNWFVLTTVLALTSVAIIERMMKRKIFIQCRMLLG